MGESRNSPRRLTAAAKRAKALELRKGGLSYARIAATPTDKANGDMRPLYRDKGAAHKAVARALEELKGSVEETAHEVLALELARLDEMHAGLWVSAVQGDPQAVGTVLKLQERRTKYQGLDFADGLEERFLAVQEAEANRTQEAFELALRDFGLSEDEVEGVFGAVARHLSSAPGAAGRDGGPPEDEDPGS